MIHKHTKIERIMIYAVAGATASDALSEAIILAFETNTCVHVIHNSEVKVIIPTKIREYILANQP